MKNYIYVIFSGEYSDWDCEGYCDTLKEAKKVCDTHAPLGWYYQKVYKQKPATRKVFYCHRFWWDRRFNRLELSNSYGCVAEYRDNKPKNEIRQRTSSIYDWRGQVIAEIWLDKGKEEKNKAQKIATDLFAKFMYEKIDTGKIK